MIWEDTKSQFISEMVFESEVKSVKINKDHFLVALEYATYIYTFSDQKFVSKNETVFNPYGTLHIAPQLLNSFNRSLRG